MECFLYLPNIDIIINKMVLRNYLGQSSVYRAQNDVMLYRKWSESTVLYEQEKEPTLLRLIICTIWVRYSNYYTLCSWFIGAQLFPTLFHRDVRTFVMDICPTNVWQIYPIYLSDKYQLKSTYNGYLATTMAMVYSSSLNWTNGTYPTDMG